MGTLPLVLFGARGYGARQGWIMLPARGVQALAPFAFGVALDHWGAASLWLSLVPGLGVFAALMLLRAREPVSSQAARPATMPTLPEKEARK